MEQITFATLAEQGKKRQTRREQLLAEMEVVVPWTTLLTLIDPHYPKAGKGRGPWPMETMPRRLLPAAAVQPVRPGHGGHARTTYPVSAAACAWTCSMNPCRTRRRS